MNLNSLKKILKKSRNVLLSPFILKDYFVFKHHDVEHRFPLSVHDFYPCVKDKTITTGFDRHYVYHTSWAARVVQEIKPSTHIDISSSLYFSGILSAFVPVEFYDYRPADLRLTNLVSREGNLHALPFADNSVESLSCMHTLEHVGLGRYGDPIDPNGDLKAIAELKRVVKSGGSLLIVVPVGQPKIEYNAHRIYSYEQIVSYVLGADFTLNEFAFIPEFESEGGLERGANPDRVKTAHYACGCFWFKKK